MSEDTVSARRKLIEVGLPLDVINAEALQRKQKAPKGWPMSVHKWWAPRPLAAARAVLFAQLVDDPSALPELFPSESAQVRERRRLFRLIGEIVEWDNSSDADVLDRAQAEIWQSWRRACADNAGHPKFAELFDRYRLPSVHDPFAGAGSIPLSAQWLGLRARATDLNPVAVVMNKALGEIPCLFSGRGPVHPRDTGQVPLVEKAWTGGQGLADDLRFYSRRLAAEAEGQIGGNYPPRTISEADVSRRPDLSAYTGEALTVVAYVWAHTVRSPNPAYRDVHVPLVTSFLLASKEGKEAYVEPLVTGNSYEFVVRVGKPRNPDATAAGTSAGKRKAFLCLLSGVPIPYDYIRQEAKAGRLGCRLMAVVAEGRRGRLYLSPDSEQEIAARDAVADPGLQVPLPDKALGFGVQEYGVADWFQLFTPRQALALTTLTDLVVEISAEVRRDAIASGLPDDNIALSAGGSGARAYSEALAVYLALVVDRVALYNSKLTGWLAKDGALRESFPMQVVSLRWDFAEGNPFGKSSCDLLTCGKVIANYLDVATPNSPYAADASEAQTAMVGEGVIFSTDPPYFDNIGFSDLSDFFYVWLRRSLAAVFPDMFGTIVTPKARELVADPHRFGGKVAAASHFLRGMKSVFRDMATCALPGYPLTLFYAFKQEESKGEEGTFSTGWEKFLEAVVGAGLSVTATWPIRTEGKGRMRAVGSNALASSIVLACRPLPPNAPTITRRDFLRDLRTELPESLRRFQASNIAPVDLAQASIGPGMAVFSRNARVVDVDGQELSIRDALTLINQVLDEVQSSQDGDYDSESRFGLTWFEEYGFDEGDFGLADGLARARNTSVANLRQAGIAVSGEGLFRLLRPEELPPEWSPATDRRLTVWDMVHHLVRILNSDGETAAARVVAELGSNAEAARELCYRLYSICERKRRAKEAGAYNGLVIAWPRLLELAAAAGSQERLDV